MPKNVLITGASSGFGEALSLAFHAAGWNVTATMRNPEKRPSSLTERPQIAVLQLDVTDSDSIRSAIAESEESFGPVDVLLNVAAYGLGGTLEEHSIAQIRDEFETNVFGLLAVTKAVLPGMRQRGVGHIINFSSASGLMGMAGSSAYSSSKFAVEGYSEAMSYDLTGTGVSVTIVEPGVFETNLESSLVRPEVTIPAYSEAASNLPSTFDYTPGDLQAASVAIATIAGQPDAPLRLYVGHGLDSVRRRYQDRLHTWASYDEVTESTK